MEVEGKELEAKEPMAETPETPEAEVPTTEPNPLEAQLSELKGQLEQRESSYKGLQSKLNQVNEELKRRTTSESRLETLEQTQRLLVAMLSERENVDVDGIPQAKKTDYLKQFDEVLSQQKVKAQQEELASKVRTYQERTNTLGLSPESEEYLEIKDLVLDGKFERAERKLTKLEQEKIVKPEVKPDLEAERAKIKAEVEKEILIKHGLINSETGQPSGVSQDYNEIRDAYLEKPTNPQARENYLKARRAKGI